jgi:glycosyltransferase involved in cell wall biosynthesis
MHPHPIIDLIIPACNEGKAIGKVIRDVPQELIREIIVCNNNSTDNTEAEATIAGATVVNEPRRGYGYACLAGMAYIKEKAKELQPDIIVFIDGDYSDFPQEMDMLIEPMRSGAQFVIGSRVTGNADRGSLTIPQQFGNWLATRLLALIWGYRFTDLGPFRAVLWDKLLELDMQDKTYGWTVEMQIKALKHKLTCAEVPVSYRQRIGQSKVSGTIKGSVMAGYKILWTIIKSV